LIENDRPVCEICHGFVEEHESNALITDAYDRARAEAAALREALLSTGGPLIKDGLWHSYSCGLREPGHGVKHCTCENQRAALKGASDDTSSL
jgi:hypothetical protein